MQDIVEKIQQGNWTAEDVDRAVLEIIRLRKELCQALRRSDDATDINED